VIEQTAHEIASELDRLWGRGTPSVAAAMLRQQHAEIDRLREQLALVPARIDAAAATERAISAALIVEQRAEIDRLQAKVAPDLKQTEQEAVVAWDVEEEEVDRYGNPIDGDEILYCCYPDCGCDGARLCMAKNGASVGAITLNKERIK
jgi:uncharacterized coiled-coil protein SlyX